MSLFTGKHDLFDIYSSYGPDFFNKFNIYFGGIRVKAENEMDIIPLYHYAVSSTFRDEEKDAVFLLTDSLIDIEESRDISNKILIVMSSMAEARANKKQLQAPDIVRAALGYNAMSKDEWMLSIIADNLSAIMPEVHNEVITQPDITVFLYKTYFNYLHTERANNLRENLLNYAADHGYGSVYKLRGQEFINKVSGGFVKEQRDAESFINLYFDDKTQLDDNPTGNITQDTYIWSPSLLDIASKVNTYWEYINKVDRSKGV